MSSYFLMVRLDERFPADPGMVHPRVLPVVRRRSVLRQRHRGGKQPMAATGLEGVGAV